LTAATYDVSDNASEFTEEVFFEINDIVPEDFVVVDEPEDDYGANIITPDVVTYA
jgi:hypothetical protein